MTEPAPNPRTTTWQLRRATPDDLDAIMLIEDAVFAPDAWSRDSMRTELSLPDGYYLVAFPVGRPEQIDAYAGLFAPHRAPSADVQTIAVADRARRGGLGRVLMTQLIAEARTRGAEEVFLEVRADNDSAQNLYRSLGFEQLAVRKGYYKGGVDALVMRLSLTPPEVSIA
jgi:ribosomal-protein-alanine acetyltransferase